MWPCTTHGLVGPMWDALVQDPSLGAAFLVITIHARLGGCQGSHSHPLSPLPGVLPGDQEADGQIGPPGPSPPAVVRLRVLRPHPTAPRPSLLPHEPRDRGWSGGHPQHDPLGSFLLGAHTIPGPGVLARLLARPRSQGSVVPPCLTFLLFFLLLFSRIISSNRSHIVKLPLSRVRGLGGLQLGCGMASVGCGVWGVGWRMWGVGCGIWGVGWRVGV